jgi:enoyl-CoA hydratase/carnithine racemase
MSDARAAGTVELALRDGVARLTLSRPDRHNAFDEPMVAALAAAVARLEREAALRCVVVAGAGASFSSGADLKMLDRLDAAGARQFMVAATSAFRRLEQLDVPVIAQVQGFCLGGGFELALHCDLIVAAAEAQLGLPEAGIGLIPTAGASARLIASIGAMRARDLLYTVRRVSGAEAARIGLACEAVAPSELAGRVEERARAIVAMPREGIAAAKRLVARRLAAEQAASWIDELEAFSALLRARGK